MAPNRLSLEISYRDSSNYEIYDKEMLAIMLALEEWRPLPYWRATEPFEIWTDHQNLQYFRQPQKG